MARLHCTQSGACSTPAVEYFFCPFVLSQELSEVLVYWLTLKTTYSNKVYVHLNVFLFNNFSTTLGKKHFVKVRGRSLVYIKNENFSYDVCDVVWNEDRSGVLHSCCQTGHFSNAVKLQGGRHILNDSENLTTTDGVY